MIILSHPSGNANVRAAASGLNEAGMLSEFRTSIASFPGSVLDKLGAIGPFSELRRRRFEPSLESLTRTWPWFEAGRLIASKTGLTNLTKHETGLLSVHSVYQKFDRNVASGLEQAKNHGVRGVYTYEDGGEFSFQEAKRLGLQCLYDLPIGYWRSARRLLEKERQMKPEWASTLTGFQDSDVKLDRKDEELRLADRIFVASHFTANTLKEFPGTLAPIEVIPYGFPPITKSKRDYPSGFSHRPLKLLFVGGLSQRKGIADLFAAVEALGQHVELTVVGRKTNSNCPALDAALAKHRWVQSLPHAQVLELMQAHDVLVFPSIFEGFGLVITEAMSQGTPVITTYHTAGPDIIEHGRNGWLVEAGSSQAIQASIEDLLSKPETIASAGKQAIETAHRRPWQVYGNELAQAIGRHFIV
jgi:glycosyltransferase involved in cell wall biosynthesis